MRRVFRVEAHEGSFPQEVGFPTEAHHEVGFPQEVGFPAEARRSTVETHRSTVGLRWGLLRRVRYDAFLKPIVSHFLRPQRKTLLILRTGSPQRKTLLISLTVPKKV